MKEITIVMGRDLSEEACNHIIAEAKDMFVDAGGAFHGVAEVWRDEDGVLHCTVREYANG